MGCDIGGTFTDFVAINDETGEFRIEKVLTDTGDPARAIFEGIRRLDGSSPGFLEKSSTIVHGTTLVTNALIERKGSRTALLTTEGFRDILEMRKELRYDVYDLQLEFPPPLVPRYLRKAVSERISAKGRILKPIDMDQLDRMLHEILQEGISSIAVCFLHAYANPEHEQIAGRFIRSRAPHIEVSLSSEVLQQIKEYERTSTTVANAYVKPKTGSYLDQLNKGLKDQGFRGKLYVMQSGGGVIGVETAREFPIRILESGPAGGFAAAQWWAHASGIEDILSFDMGGTTAKMCATSRGNAVITNEYEAARVYRFKKGSGLAVSVPVLDMLEIGAGGGSIASVDSLGLVKVGPRSAGAAPGPACYGLGGKAPTVTDADLVLGYLNADYFLGGKMPLHRESAEEAIMETVGRPLGMDLAEAAFGIHDIVNENMAAAASLHMAERGEDPACLAIVAYGGAGPVHAYGLARKIGNRRIMIPRAAGVTSALGFLAANISIDASRTYKTLIDALVPEDLGRVFQELESRAGDMLPPAAGKGRIVLHRRADMQYAGQGYGVHVDLPGETEWQSITRGDILDRFNHAYERLYGRIYPDVDVEIVNLRADAEIVPDRIFSLPQIENTGRDLQTTQKGERKVYFPETGGYCSCPIYDRNLLESGHGFEGPAVVEERESTTIVGPGAAAQVDRLGMLVIRMEEE